VVVGAVAVAAGVLVALLAVDVGRWHAALANGDLRYARQPLGAYPWRADAILPFGAGEGLLGVEHAVAYRRAVRLFRLGEPRAALPRPGAARLRAEAQALLARGARDPAEATLLGSLLLASTAAATDRTTRLALLDRAAASFSAAIRADPENADAKYDLELALVRERRLEFTPAAGKGAAPSARGATHRRSGHGY
jgi:hypothetical protein